MQHQLTNKIHQLTSKNSSFGHALLRFRKSKQHLICPYFFLTTTSGAQWT